MEDEDEKLVRVRFLAHSARLVDARKERGMTQVELAQATGIFLHRLAFIETLKINPREEEMLEIACVLEKPIDYLFPEQLAPAINAGVFSRRKVALSAPQVISLTEAAQQNLLPVSGRHELEEEVEKRLLSEAIKESLSELRPREIRVLTLRYGLEDGVPRSLEEIGNMDEFRLTRQSIRQIQQKALRKLRQPYRSRNLAGFLE